MGQPAGEGEKAAKSAIEAYRAQMRLGPSVTVKVEKVEESPVPGFYQVKAVQESLSKLVPVTLYVDKNGEKVFIGNLWVGGKNVTAETTGKPQDKPIDMVKLDLEKSPFLGEQGAPVVVVEFSDYF